jgi:hypothetical protein
MQEIWKITFNGVTKTAAAWGLTAQPILDLPTQGGSKFTWRMAGADPVGVIPFPFESQVTIFRELDGVKDFTFIGRQTTQNGIADPSEQGINLVFQDAWYDLENIVYKQQWKSGTIVNGQVVLNNVFFSRVFLFVDALGQNNGQVLTIAQQITNIINYAAACGANLQVGAIDPGFQQNAYPLKGVTCAEAIRKCLELLPDCAVWIDSSSGVPKFYAKQNLVPKTLPYAGKDALGRDHKSSRITPREDLQVSQVVLEYQQTNYVNSEATVAISTDVFPVGSTGQALRALNCPIDLRGSQITETIGQVSAAAFAPADPALAFWKEKFSKLKDPRVTGLALVESTINSGKPNCITVTDSAGNPVDLNQYPNLWQKGTVARWMRTNRQPVKVIEVVVAASFGYVESAGPGTSKTKTFSSTTGGDRMHCRVKLTNSPVGVIDYATDQTTSIGESPIPGLAEQYYNSVSKLQYEGSHVVLEVVVAEIIGPWNTLNISGGKPEWENMEAMISAVTIDFYHGRTTIQFGPAKHLSPQDLNTFLQYYRCRTIFDFTQMPVTGNAGGSNTVDIGSEQPNENSIAGIMAQSMQTYLSAPDADGNSAVIQHDPDNQQFLLKQIDKNGVDVPNVASALLSLKDMIFPQGQNPLPMKAQPYQDGAGKTQYVFSTAPVSGGGGSLRYKITGGLGVKSDFFLATPAAGGAEIAVAKHYSHRPSILQETLFGTVLTYTYHDNNNRTSSDGANAQEEQLHRAYQINDIIFVNPCADTGIPNVTMIDATARVWARKSAQ